MDTAHLMMQSKGGVGKSVISALLAEYFYEKHNGLKIISTGPIHYTLAKYEALNVLKIQHSHKNNQVNQSNFDSVFNNLISDEGSILVDTSSNDFLPINDYLIQDELSKLLSENNRQLMIHCPIVYGRSKDETVDCLVEILKNYPDTPVIVWENEFFGKSKNSFVHKSLFSEPNNIIGFIKLEYISDDIEKRAFFKMLENFMLFNEVDKDDNFTYIEEHALDCIKNKIWEQLDIIFNKIGHSIS